LSGTVDRAESAPPPDPEPNHRSLPLFLAFWIVSRGELRRVGLLNPKGSRTGILTGTLYLLVVLLCSLLPTWPGEAAPYFLAVVGLTGAWVIAAPHVASELATVDAASVAPRLLALEHEVRARAAGTWGVEAAKPPDRPAADDALRSLFVRHFLPYFGSVMLTRQVLGVAPVSVVAIVGIMEAPRVQALHFGFWHPVGLWYALPLPYVFSIVMAIVMLMVARLYLSAAQLADRVNREAGGAPPPDPPG